MKKNQINFLKKIGVDPKDALDVIEDKVAEYLSLYCLDENYYPNSDGVMCESILDYISNQ